MSWRPDKGRAICPQICEHICEQIARGELSANERLPSVRDYAVQIGVNPNTVQRAFEQLGQDGVLYAVQNVGWFIGEDDTAARQTVQHRIEEKTAAYFEEMRNLGLDADAIKAIVKEWNV